MAGLMALVLAAALRRFVSGEYWQDAGRVLMTLYVVPMYLLAPAWAAAMLERPGRLVPWAVWVDYLAVAVAASRTVTNVLPASGHVVFLVYTVVVTGHRAYRAVAGGYLALSLAGKFLLWHDFVTPVVGGLVAWGLWWLRGRASKTEVGRPGHSGSSEKDTGPM
jgi:hypothetical protein